MNIFLAQMAEEYAGQKILLIMDGAGWHKSGSLRVPDSIKIIILPPYSPELNPVERFWQHVKDNVLKNRIYESLEDLQTALSQYLHDLPTNVIQSVCQMHHLSHYL
jgi:transposase